MGGKKEIFRDVRFFHGAIQMLITSSKEVMSSLMSVSLFVC